MTVLFFDIHSELGSKITPGMFELVNFTELLYADDTLLIGKRGKELNMLLESIGKHSTSYGLALNKKKCHCIQMNVRGKVSIQFSTGEALSSVEEADYLGTKLTRKHLTRRELESRLGKALATTRKLHDFFKRSGCNKSWKLQVYNAVIVTRLTYGLDSVELTDSLKKRLNAFQLRGIRIILGIQHAFWSRTSTMKSWQEQTL